MNATEFFFAVVAVFGATSLIYAWYAWIYGLDDGYQESIARKRKRKVIQVAKQQVEQADEAVAKQATAE